MAERSPQNDGPQAPPKKTTGGSGWVGMSSLGFEFLAAILLPGALGWWIDGKLGSAPWLMLLGGVLGFCAGLYLLLRQVNQKQ